MGSAAARPPDASGPVLRLSGMTFVQELGPGEDVVVRSERAFFYPGSDVAELEVVHAVFTDDLDQERFEVTCDSADLNVETHDFVARGNVRGTTAEGHRYTAPIVYYDHADGLLHSAERVRVQDDTGTFEGDGFHYRVSDGHFKLLDNVRAVQLP